MGLFGEPKNATYYPNVGPNGIDTSGTLVMEYDGFSAVCTEVRIQTVRDMSAFRAKKDL